MENIPMPPSQQWENKGGLNTEIRRAKKKN